MTLDAKIGGFMDFFGDFGLRHLYQSQGGATVLSLCALRCDCNKGVVFYPKFSQIWLKQWQTFIVRFHCIVSAIIYYLVHFWCRVFGETVCTSYSVRYSVFCSMVLPPRDIGLQRPALTNADWLHWLSCYIFTHESSYCFHCVLAIAVLSVCLSVHTGGSVKSGAS